MQNRYFGDVGDFTKYGLLRNAAKCVSKLGILWCLANDENHNMDGKHIIYLKNNVRNSFRNCDPELYDALKGLLVNTDGNIIHANRNVSLFKDLHLLPENTAYFEEVISVSHDLRQRERERDCWFDRASQALKDCDLAFCDPDNGIEVPSASKRTKKHFKYIYWNELKSLWDDGKSLIIYQHMHMGKPHLSQLNERVSNIVEVLNTDTVMSLRCFRGTVRTYLLVPQPLHEKCFTELYKSMVSGPWSQHIEPWD
ncbi:MAG: hypothetical protein ABIK45_06240 [Pseudomonadota bacterium]